jgi:hypothetical protein
MLCAGIATVLLTISCVLLLNTAKRQDDSAPEVRKAGEITSAWKVG